MLMLAINKIVLGTVQFGLEYGINNSSGKPSQETIQSVLDTSYEHGIRLLDTAEAYGDSQEIIGNYHTLSASKYDVITKFSSTKKDFSEKLNVRISQILKILNVDSLYCYMFHSFNDFKSYFDSYKNEIKELKKSGAINKFGVSIYTNDEIEQLLAYENIDLIQLPFNLLDNDYQRSAVIKKAKSKGIEIHARSIFLQGLFFKNIDHLPLKLRPLKEYLQQLILISEKYKISIENIALQYVLSKKYIDYVLIGVDNVAQLKKNLEIVMSEQNMDEIFYEIDQIKVTADHLLNPSNWQ